MKKLLTLTLLLLLPLLAKAYDAEVDGIYYNLDTENKVAEVTYQKYDENTSPWYFSNYSGAVVIPEKFSYDGIEFSVKTIGTNAFRNCDNLLSVTIPNSVTRLLDSAFSDCNSLNSITIPNSVIIIGRYAFIDCSRLTSLSIPNSVIAINTGAFSGCSGLTSLFIPRTVRSIGTGAFEGCSGLTSIVVEEGNNYYDSRDGCNAIIESETNTLIAGCVNTFFPNSVTSIGVHAFCGCSSLKSISIPSSVTSIGFCAFKDCTSLSSLTIPYSVTSIEDWVFYGCSSLSSVTIPNSITSIGEYAFYKCASLSSVTIPNSVTSIGDFAFEGCSGLTTVSLGNSITRIGWHAFTYCEAIDTVHITDLEAWFNISFGASSSANPLSYAHHLLLNGEEIKDLVIPNCVTKIEACAFSSFDGLTSVTIPNSVTSIESWAFYKCTNLISVTIGNSVTSIENYAFSGCSSLNSVTIGNSVTSIGDEAFLTTSLTTITSFITDPFEIKSLIFAGITKSDGTLFVPLGTKEKYKQTAGWNFKHIVEIGSPSNIAIDETTFPDENFRNWILSQDYGADGILTEDEIMNVTSMNVSGKSIADLTGIGYFTSLTTLYCGDNQLTSLDVSNNTALTALSCNSNQLTALDVSNNTALTSLYCDFNQMTSLDVSNNTALATLYCTNNQLTSLDVSKNTELVILSCFFNEIKGAAMDALIASLPKTTEASFFIAVDHFGTYEKNVVTKAQVEAAKEKGWKTTDSWWLEYEGCDPVTTGIAIDATNFPDENFRNWILSQDYGADGVLTEEEIAKIFMIDVSLKNIADLKGIEFFTALEQLRCHSNQLTSLDISKNSALDVLDCHNNQLASLDVSMNTTLYSLYCDHNQIASLDVSENTKLKWLNCSSNKLTSLDVTNNTLLEDLICDANQLGSLDVSKNTVLVYLSCNNTQLTSLNVSNNLKLVKLYCCNNMINGTAMDALISGLPNRICSFYAISPFSGIEHNIVTKAQVAAAKEKGWTTYYFSENDRWEEYEGSEPELTPVDNGEVVDLGTEISEDTDLDGNVVGNIYYSISSGDGSYNPTEGCLVLTKPTNDLAINLYDIFSEYFKEQFNGLAFKLAPGKGSIKVEAETQGNMVLKVKIGNNDPIEMELDGKLKVKFPYNVSEETLVYIYGGMSTAGAKATGGTRASSDADLLKIYGFEIVSDASGIEATESGLPANADAPVYNLNGQRVDTPTKGIYIKNGRKVLVK